MSPSSHSICKRPFLALAAFLLTTLTSPWASAAESTEIYYGLTTPSGVADALVKDQGASSSQFRLFALVGAPLTDIQAPSGISLTASAISPVTASSSGFPTFVQAAITEARKHIRGLGDLEETRMKGAAEYRYGFGQNGKEASWDIHFAEVPNYDPELTNFDPTKLSSASERARTAIRANPYRTGSGSGYEVLFEAAYEGTVPYTYAGNAWRALAEKERTNVAANPPPSNNDRISRLQEAAARYRMATLPLLSLLNHSVESRYLWDPRSFIGDGGAEWGMDSSLWEQTWDQLLFEAYIEGVSKLGECQFELLHARYFQNYRNPDAGGFDRAPLLTEIQEAADEIEMLMLPVSAGALNGLVNERFDMARALSQAGRLRRLADHVTEYALVFSAGFNPQVQSFTYGTYGPNYIPFLVPTQLQQRPFTFDNFRALVFGGDEITGIKAKPDSLIGISIDADAIAYSAIDNVITTTEQLDNLRDDTRSTYQSQLSQMVGQLRSDPANPFSPLIPDLLGYVAPTEYREPRGAGETYGDVALQWAKIDQAETRLLSAYRALAEIDEEAQLIRDYGDERLLSYDRIATIQLDSGEQISALNYISGEIRAKAIEQEAEARAKATKKKSWFGAVAKWSVRIGAAVVTGGASVTAELTWKLASGDITRELSELAGDVGAVVDGVRQAQTEAELHREVGRIQTDATRRQAEIEGKQTRIRAMEGAKITIEQQGQEDNRIREAIHKLMIRVERQQLEILLAQQQLDFAELEHANMIGRISYLIEEYRRVTIRQSASTLNRPDIRLRRDYEIQEANRKFRVTQEYSYLLARAADYRFGINQTFRTQIANETQAILRAQNGNQLEGAVIRLIQVREAFLNQTGGMAGLKEVRYSLRDLVAQSNHADAVDARDLNGEWKPGSDPRLLQPFSSSILSGTVDPVALSDEQFVQYLRANLVPDPEAPGSRILRLRFAIGYEPMPIGEDLDEFGDPMPSGKENPLRTQVTSQFGHVIEGAGPSYASANAVGVFLNIRNRSSIPIGVPTTATLKPVGTFYTTTSNVPSPTGVISNLRAWNPVNVDGLRLDDNGNIRDAFVDNSIRIIHNGDTRTEGWKTSFAGLGLEAAGSKLHERSPANDHWLLELKAANSTWSEYLPNIRDIEVCMTIRGW